MKSMKIALAAVGIVGLAIPAAVAAKKVRIYTQKVDADKICGSEYGENACSMTKQSMRLSEADIALQTSGATPNHFQVLGKYYTGLTGTALSLNVCGAGDDNPFEATDIADITVPAAFSYKKRSDTTVSAGLAADVKNALVAGGVPAAQLENLQAQFNASYKKAAGRDHEMTGTYYRVQLRDNVIQAIKNPSTSNAKALACAAKLRSIPKSALVYSIAVIKLEKASYASNVATDAAADFAAKVRAKAPNADIASVEAGIKTAVKTALTVNLGTEYRVISWDYMTAKNLNYPK